MKLFLFLIALTPITASANADPSQNVFREEANAFCLVHSIDYWKETGQLEALHTLDPTQRQIRLAKEIRSTITSEEMVRVIYEEAQALSAEEFYPYLQRELPKLTGQPFECPNIKDFYLAH